MRTIRIGTRASRLAMIQAEMLAQAIRDYDPILQTELIPMTTTGDKILDRPLDAIGGKGLFVKELDQALLDGRVDITVHSCKDLPMDIDEELPIVAVSDREDPRDALVLPKGSDALSAPDVSATPATLSSSATPATPDASLPIGCSSARRRIQLQKLFPQSEVSGVRGNVLTRLGKLDAGNQYAALTLAAAGLKRLGLTGRISRVFTVDEMIPAACQGILAVQARAGTDTGYLAGFHNAEVWLCMLAERAFIRALDGGCSAPCAAYASVDEGRVNLKGLYVNEDESRIISDSVTISALDALEVEAMRFAERMKQHA